MALAVTEEQKTKTELTADDLWQHPTAEKYELVKGELVEMTPPGGLHGSIAVRLAALIVNFATSQNLGEVMVETGYRLTTNPDTVRAPDVSFLPTKNIPTAGLPEGYIAGAPDLAVEVGIVQRDVRVRGGEDVVARRPLLDLCRGSSEFPHRNVARRGARGTE